MSGPCDGLDAFFDGELAPEEAAAFREHLGGCADCQAQLHDLLQLDDLARECFATAASPGYGAS